MLTNPNPGQLTNDQYKGRTPLHYAAEFGHLPVVQHICNLLKDKNPKDANDHTPLHLAASNGHLDVVKFLVQHVKDKHPKDGVYWGQKTPLDWAKQKGFSEVVNFLKERSILHDAAQKGELELVKQLVINLEDKNPKDEKGITPLQLAAGNGHLHIVEYLLQHIEGDINPSDSNGFTPLHDAAFNGHLNVVS